MSKTWIAATAAALLLSVGAVHSASASSVINFEDVTPDGQIISNTVSHGGLSFGVGYGMYFGPAFTGFQGSPDASNNTFLTAALWQIEGVGLTLDSNSDAFTNALYNIAAQTGPNAPPLAAWPTLTSFNLNSFSIARGFCSDDPSDSNPCVVADYTTITAYFANGGKSTLATHFTLGDAFTTYNNLGLNNVVGLVFNAPVGGSRMISFDNVSYSTGGVPEPATWAMMLLGFGGLGAVLRGNRRRALALAA